MLLSVVIFCLYWRSWSIWDGGHVTCHLETPFLMFSRVKVRRHCLFLFLSFMHVNQPLFFLTECEIVKPKLSQFVLQEVTQRSLLLKASFRLSTHCARRGRTDSVGGELSNFSKCWFIYIWFHWINLIFTLLIQFRYLNIDGWRWDSSYLFRILVKSVVFWPTCTFSDCFCSYLLHILTLCNAVLFLILPRLTDVRHAFLPTFRLS